MATKEKQTKQTKKEQQLQKRCEELEHNLKRAMADYANLKRRVEGEKMQIIKFANKELIAELLPVIDNFENVVNHLNDSGLKITFNHFLDTLKRQGLEPVNVLNTKFDPNLCEAVELVKGEKDLVVEVMQKGYKYNNNLLRPARVKVGKG